MISATALLIDALQQAGLQAGVSVPGNLRPPYEFVTVERVGGNVDLYGKRDTAAMVIEVYEKSMLAAEEVAANIVIPLIVNLSQSVTAVLKTEITSHLDNPMPVGTSVVPCYEINVQITLEANYGRK
ncbi:hypothetical protein [Aeriscardovia aeriphila]|uniref:Uncharacterized protein n=1 Tax=Aeriscardovia aeriphila TaxID=218139 RepID=A0A261FAE8_9BIFI|nr:hypothetical protein [Aeriscardovia aeriphila]NYI25782.1 flagellar assembly factor FliW [Aeriscardovia aeriphila]OZG56068.1 hypothetical protein AEAE_0556 [Aeriscardovia aeriphila]